MKVLITGGFGFLGQKLCRLILAHGEAVGADEAKHKVSEVLLFDSAPAPPSGLVQDPRVRTASGDVADAATVDALVDQDGIIVFHLASVMSGQGEADFDLCVRVNIQGTRNLLEACRRRKGSKFIFASTGACYGERPEGLPETDATKLLPHTTYGMTKACCELMINDYSRRGFLDGRVARLPTVVPRPEVNSGLPAAFSAVIREPLKGQDVELPVRPDMPHAVCGFRVLVHNLLRLAELPQAVFAGRVDRCMNMPSLSVTLADLEEAVRDVVRDPSRLGRVTYKPDEALCAKLSTFHRDMDASRARGLGMLGDSCASALAVDFAAEYLDPGLLKPVLELRQEPRHNLVLANEAVRVFRTEFPPGDSTLTHAHRVDSLYFFLGGAEVRNTKEGAEPLDDTLAAGEVRYGDHCSCPLVHTVANRGSSGMFCLDVELARFDAEAPTEPAAKRPRASGADPPAGLVLTKERRGARVYELEVPAGSAWHGALPYARMLTVVRSGPTKVLGWPGDGGKGERLLLPADVFFSYGPQELSLEVAGEVPLKLWLVELL